MLCIKAENPAHTKTRQKRNELLISSPLATPPAVNPQPAAFCLGKHLQEAMTHMAEEHNVAMAVNGDYCGFRSNGIVIRNGVIYRDAPTKRNCYVLYTDGTAEVVKESDTSAQELLDGGSSVTLYDNGEIVNQPCWWFADEREISDIVYIEKPQSDAQDDTQTAVQDETQSDAQTE